MGQASLELNTAPLEWNRVPPRMGPERHKLAAGQV